jgi:predicted SnoaL-like aldol condensation-catalyzing enzyme
MNSTTLTQRNKQRVAQYDAQVWNEKNLPALPEFIAVDYIQHNPKFGNGRAALQAFLGGLFEALPQGRFEIARLVAEDDLVVAHTLFRAQPGDRGTAVADVYRLRDGELVEHWDVKEEVPETSVNSNTMV